MVLFNMNSLNNLIVLLVPFPLGGAPTNFQQNSSKTEPGLPYKENISQISHTADSPHSFYSFSTVFPKLSIGKTR